MAEAAGVAATGRLETEMVVTDTRAAGPTMRGGDTMGNTAERGGDMSPKRKKSQGNCYNCGRLGHRMKDCKAKKR